MKYKIKFVLITLALMFVLLITGCSKVRCEEPYSIVSGKCCIDQNKDYLCDNLSNLKINTTASTTPEDSQEECPVCEVLDLSKCPKIVETQQLMNYACPDGKIVEEVGECYKAKKYKFDPVLTNEEGSKIDSIEIKPTCVGRTNGGAITYKIKEVPYNITYQAKTNPSEEFKDLGTIKGAFAETRYFSICPKQTCKGDFVLPGEQIYLFRIKFDYTKYDEYGRVRDTRIEYSNEYILDFGPETGYMILNCVTNFITNKK